MAVFVVPKLIIWLNLFYFCSCFWLENGLIFGIENFPASASLQAGNPKYFRVALLVNMRLGKNHVERSPLSIIFWNMKVEGCLTVRRKLLSSRTLVSA